MSEYLKPPNVHHHLLVSSSTRSFCLPSVTAKEEGWIDGHLSKSKDHLQLTNMVQIGKPHRFHDNKNKRNVHRTLLQFHNHHP